MKTIHKYPLTQGVTKVTTFEGARFIAVDTQGEQVTVWAEVDPGRRECEVTLHIVPTGGEVPANTEHLGTTQTVGGMFVWHVYRAVR